MIEPTRNSAELIRSSLAPARDWRARLPFFYGWIIVAGTLICLGLSYSVMYSFSVFYVALLEEFAWGRAEAAGVYSVFSVISGVGALGAGALSDRFGSGRVIAGGGILLAAGLIICSQLTELWQFYVAYGVIVAIGVSIAGWTACVTMVNHWFSARLGFALGIASGGIGVGIMVIVPLVQILITNFGWRSAFVWLAGMALFGLLPVGLIVLRGCPEDLGQQADGAGSVAVGDAQTRKPLRQRGVEVVDEKWASRNWTLGTALKTARLWLLAALKLVGGISTQLIFVHQVVYLVDSGYDKMLAASIVGLIGFLSVAAKVFWGWSADTIGREMTYTLGSLAMVLAVVLLALAKIAPSVGMLYLYAVVFALGYGVAAPLWPIVTSDLFAGRNFGAIYGFIGVFNGIGNALGAWVGGYVFDLTGSYAIAFAVAVAGTAISAGAMWIVAPRKVRRVLRPQSAA